MTKDTVSVHCNVHSRQCLLRARVCRHARIGVPFKSILEWIILRRHLLVKIWSYYWQLLHHIDSEPRDVGDEEHSHDTEGRAEHA